jgi:hypothetical protein
MTAPEKSSTPLDLTAEDGDVLPCASLIEAEDLLDWLQNQGCTQIALRLIDDQVTVRCVCPPGLRLMRDADGKVCLRPI